MYSDFKIDTLKIKPIFPSILGIISIGLSWLSSAVVTGLGIDYLITMSIAFICAIWGLILGTKGIKTDKKNLAIIGIILCSLGLIGAILMFIGWLTVGGPTEL